MARMRKRPMPSRTSRSPVQTPGLRFLRVFAANRWDSRQEAQEAQIGTQANQSGCNHGWTRINADERPRDSGERRPPLYFLRLLLWAGSEQEITEATELKLLLPGEAPEAFTADHADAAGGG